MSRALSTQIVPTDFTKYYFFGKLIGYLSHTNTVEVKDLSFSLFLFLNKKCQKVKKFS